MSSRSSSDEFYSSYWTSGVGSWHVHAELFPAVREFLLNLTRGKEVLDFGGGDGERYGRVVQAAAGRYTVADVSSVVLQKRREDGAQTVHVADLADSGLTFDVVLCLEVLEHLEDPESACKLIASCAKPGASLLLSVPNAFSLMNRVRMLAGRMPSSGVGISLRRQTYLAPHVKFFDPGSLVAMAERAGLRPVRLFTDKIDAGRYWQSKGSTLRSLSIERESSLLASTLFLLCRLDDQPSA